MSKLVVTSTQVLSPESGAFEPLGVVVDATSGKVDRVIPRDQALSMEGVIDAGDKVVMPGVIDTHVHVNEPGRTEWEGFETVTRAAASGGITTLYDMPLNSIPPTTSCANLDTKLAAAKGKCSVDVGFIGGVVPGNAAEIVPMVKRGVKFFKCFLIHSGVDEFPHVTEEDLHLAFAEFQKTDATFLFHAEVDCGVVVPAEADVTQYPTFVDSRPPVMETKAIEMVIRLCRQYKVPCHIVHLSCADALPLIRAAKGEGLPLTIETCHHYLTFTAEQIKAGDTISKCCPPIRSVAHQTALWDALLDGTIDMIVSDHSPSSPDVKQLDTGDLMTAWGGIAGVQFGLSASWTQCKSKGIPLTKLHEWMTTNTSRMAKCDTFKGKLAPGYDADFIIFDPNESWTVEQEGIEHRHKLTPYLKRSLYGKVHYTFLRGRTIFDASKGGVQPPPSGSFLLA